MVKINLLPWREYEKAYERKFWKRICISIVIISSVLFTSIKIVLMSEEKNHQARIEKLQNEIKKYNVRTIKKQSLHSPINIELTRVNDLLAKLNSSSQVCFSTIERVDKKIVFQGKAYSVMELTEFLSAWKAASSFSQIKIHSMKQQLNSEIEFKFEATQDLHDEL